MELEYVEYGLGYYIPSEKKILLNKALLKYPKLHEKILDHEMEHAESPRTSFVIDLFEPFDFEILSFILSHPKTWTQYFPVSWENGKVYYNWYLILMYILMILTIAGCLYAFYL